jgi:PAS domain S-box-containing protein
LEKETPDSGLLEELKQLRAKLAELEYTKANDNTGVEQLGASEERFRLLVESVKDYAIFMLDPKGKIASWNAGAQKIKGYEAKEIIGQHFSKFYPPEDLAWNKPAWELEQAILAGRFEDEGWRLRKDGTRFWANVTITALWDEQGILRGFAKVTHDMTDRKMAEEAIRRSNATLEKRVKERTAQLSFLSEASKLLGSSFDYEVTLQRVAQLAVPDMADWCTVYIIEDGKEPRQVALAHAEPAKVAWANNLQQHLQNKYSFEPDALTGLPAVLRTGQPELYQEITDDMIQASAKDDEFLGIFQSLNIRSLMIVPLIAREKVLGAIQLVSTRQDRLYNEYDLKLTQELAQRAAMAVDNAKLYRDAQQAIAIRNEFVSVAAHELKTPITSLRGFTQLLLRKVNGNNSPDLDQLRQGLNQVNNQSNRLVSLVGRLLDMSQLEAGKLMLSLENTDLGQMLHNLVAAAQLRTDKHKITISAPAHFECHLDPLRFEQVMTNLLDNAIKYSPEGGQIKLEMQVLEGGPDGPTVKIRVQDQGIGIEPENRERIFEPFFQGNERGYAGLGLGLYISREIVELHGGDIETEPGESGGSAFIVTVPVKVREGLETVPERAG